MCNIENLHNAGFLFLKLQKKIVMSYNYDSRASLNFFRFNYIFIFYQLVTFLSKNNEKSFERIQKMLFLSFLVNDQFTS